ncbi:HD-GYP domain-containing protein [Lichenicola sp.]|uniref:HD-GYP domain-containing protein n=1 Tax=Lichenicola sp. TaxID=2804529 RepID=UPI003B00C68C
MVHRLATRAGSGPDQANLLQAIMPVCNIGRLAVPDAILNRAGPLDEEERRIMQAHPRIGARLLAGSASPLVALAAEVALCQHERWDGSGYPAGLVGQQIPLGARIVAIAESFDASLSAPSCGPGRRLGRAVEHMRRDAGARFDPMLTRVFLDDLPAMIRLREQPGALQPGEPAGLGRRARPSAPASNLPALANRLRLGLRAALRPA